MEVVRVGVGHFTGSVHGGEEVLEVMVIISVHVFPVFLLFTHAKVDHCDVLTMLFDDFIDEFSHEVTGFVEGSRMDDKGVSVGARARFY